MGSHDTRLDHIVGKRLGSHDAMKWESGLDHMIQVGKRVGSHDTSGKEGGIT